MVIAALITFAILMVAWLVAPGEGRAAKPVAIEMEGRLAEAA
jgi:hypothetical protein